jgi:hypothetical protein
MAHYGKRTRQQTFLHKAGTSVVEVDETPLTAGGNHRPYTNKLQELDDLLSPEQKSRIRTKLPANWRQTLKKRAKT